jgi:hypothetical protein
MPESQIQARVDSLAAEQVPNQFGSARYALLFEPGTYGSSTNPLIFQLGYYTQVAGLGASPADVTINGSVDVYNQCVGAQCTALNNFWRSLSNLTIDVAGGSGCQSRTEFWAASQAAPIRRVDINGKVSLMDYCNGTPGYASGGFMADSVISGAAMTNGSQQQYVVRNTILDGWSNGVWNQVFVGDLGAPAQSFAPKAAGTAGANPYTVVVTAPVTQEPPLLYVDGSRGWAVFVPAVRRDSIGPSWTGGGTAGTSVPISKFFIASPLTSERSIDAALAAGQDLILSPGVYDLDQPIHVTRPDTIVMGLGFATLVPQKGNAAMLVSTSAKLSGIIFDAGPQNSTVLLQLGSAPGLPASAASPTLVQDVFFRIGGAAEGKATTSLVVNSSDTILDDVWAWRADHGSGVGWTGNTADTGLVVNGDSVTAYGLFVEHYQKTQVIWSGDNGRDYFFQSEMPYDPPTQAAWMQNNTTTGYPSLMVAPGVTTFIGYGFGTYSNFDRGVPINASNAYVSPRTAGISMNDLLTVYLNGAGGIDNVINGSGTAVNAEFGGPSDVVSYP